LFRFISRASVTATFPEAETGSDALGVRGLVADYASEFIADHLGNPDELSYREVESIIYGLARFEAKRAHLIARPLGRAVDVAGVSLSSAS